MKHTPAPWRVKYAYYVNRPSSITTDTCSVASFNAALWDKDWAQAAANANLISAAPDLLAAIKPLIEAMIANDMQETYSVFLKHAREAVEKAEPK